MRGLKIILLIVVLLVGGLTAAFRAPDTTPRVAVFTPELTPLLDVAQPERTIILNGVTFTTARLAENDVLLVASTDPAAVRAALERFEITAVILNSRAEAINTGLQPGDIAVPRRWGPVNDVQPWLEVDSEMLAVAAKIEQAAVWSACSTDDACVENSPQVLVGGSGVSDNAFLNSPAAQDDAAGTLQVNVLDTVTAPAAASVDVPFIALSGIASEEPSNPLVIRSHTQAILAFLELWAERCNLCLPPPGAG